MITRKQIVAEKEGLVGLKNLVEVYQEVAAGRMQRVRGAVLQSRMFMQGLLDVFKRVRAAYKGQKITSKSTRQLNGRTAAVFVSANAGLYGDIVDRTFMNFSSYVKKNNPDVVVLGRLGVKMMADGLPQVLYNYFDFTDDSIDMESFEMIMRYLIQFEKIAVFHGQFKSIMSQDPIMTPVSGESLENVETGDSKVAYLFEPSVEDISRIFEGEILASIVEQTLHESMLAKFASRMLTLDRSIESIEKRLVTVKSEERIIAHKVRNRKQLNTLAGISLWS